MTWVFFCLPFILDMKKHIKHEHPSIRYRIPSLRRPFDDVMTTRLLCVTSIVIPINENIYTYITMR